MSKPVKTRSMWHADYVTKGHKNTLMKKCSPPQGLGRNFYVAFYVQNYSAKQNRSIVHRSEHKSMPIYRKKDDILLQFYATLRRVVFWVSGRRTCNYRRATIRHLWGLLLWLECVVKSSINDKKFYAQQKSSSPQWVFSAIWISLFYNWNSEKWRLVQVFVRSEISKEGAAQAWYSSPFGLLSLSVYTHHTFPVNF